MSTCITNGYILETSNSKKVNKVNERLRIIFNQILKDTLVSNMVSIMSPIANYTHNLKSDCADRPETYLECIQSRNHELQNKAFELNIRQKFRNDEGTLFDFTKDTIQLMSKQNIQNQYSLNSEAIYFKSIGTVTLYFFAVSTAIAEQFQKINQRHHILKNYEYYDNTDKPDDVTTKAWKHREHTWNRVLGKSINVSDVMYNIPIKVDFYDLREEDVVAELPDEAERLRSLYKRSRLNELCQSLLAEYEKKIGSTASMSEYSNIYFDAAEKVADEVKNGLYLNSQKHLDMLVSQEDYLHAIFYKKHIYFKKEF